MTKAELIKSMQELPDDCEVALDTEEKRVIASRTVYRNNGRIFVLYTYNPTEDDRQVALTLVA